MPDLWKVDREVLSGDVQTWSGYRLGHNELGLWLYIEAGTPVHDARGQLVDTLQAQAVLVPDDRPWVGAWRQDGSTIANVTTPPLVEARSVRYVDLGLTASLDGSGVVDTNQSDALDRAVATGRLAAEKVSAARSTLAELVQQLTEGARVEHVGSTSVPGLAAKDCIDIAVVVPRLGQIDEAVAALAPLGYQARPNAFDDPGHVFLRRLGNGQRSHHLHLYQEGHQNLIEVLAFRDLLRADPDARERYQSVKKSLAEANPYDRGGYLAGKTEVVQELVQLALARFQDGAPHEGR